MPHPSSQRWYEALGDGITNQDPDRVLLELLDSVGTALGQVDDLVRDSPDGAGWTALLDPDRTPSPAYTGQFVGVRLPGGISDSEARALLVARPATRRGTVQALLDTARMYLTGTRRVEITERDGSAYRFTIRTYGPETPDPAALEAAVRAVKPAGLVLTVQVFDGSPYDVRDPEYASYNALDASAATYDAMDARLY